MIKIYSYIIITCAFSIAYSQRKKERNYHDVNRTKIHEIYSYSLKDSLLSGVYESFYLNGSTKNSGWFEKNRPDSVWIYYYENGGKKAKGSYKKGVKVGKWTHYFENGNKKSIGALKGDFKYDLWKYFYKNGRIKSIGEYEANKKIGLWNYFYQDSSLKAQTIIEDGIANYTEFYPSGGRKVEGENRNGKSEGEWSYYYETGELEAVGNFKNGVKTEEWIYYYKSSQKAALGSYQNGYKQGKWTYYHENGTVSRQGNLVNNQQDGFWELFYPTGDLHGKIVFNLGNGLINEYYPNGNQKLKGTMVNGKKTGKFYYYNEDGGLEGEANLIDGKGYYTGYYIDGEVKMTGEIENEKRIGEWEFYSSDGSIAGIYTPVYKNERFFYVTKAPQGLDKKKVKNHPQKKGLRYFLPRLNEYKSLIIATNPIWIIENRLPFSFEYYIQERLGYEIQVEIYRNPFFKNHNDIGDYQVYKNGIRFHFKQKFYHTNSNIGMFYFGHALTFNYMTSHLNHLDTLIFQQPRLFGQLEEISYGYSIIIGDRWITNVSRSGFTIDFFIGIGIEFRSFNKKHKPNPVLHNYFNEEIKSSIHFPITFGLNIGFALGGNKFQ